MKVARTFRLEEYFAKRLEKESKDWTAAEGRKVSQADVIERVFGLYDEAVAELAKEQGVEVSGDGKTILDRWVKQDGVTEAEVLLEALRVYDASRTKPQDAPSTGERLSQVPSTPVQSSGFTGNPGQGQTFQPQGSSGGYDATCGHCGGGFQIPAGRPPSTLCLRCFGLGHRNIPNCFECAKREHLRKLAAEDKTGGSRNDIDYIAFE